MPPCKRAMPFYSNSVSILPDSLSHFIRRKHLSKAGGCPHGKSAGPGTILPIILLSTWYNNRCIIGGIPFIPDRSFGGFDQHLFHPPTILSKKAIRVLSVTAIISRLRADLTCSDSCSGRAAAGVPSRREYGKTCTRAKPIFSANAADAAKSSSVSPGNPTRISVVIAGSAKAFRIPPTIRYIRRCIIMAVHTAQRPVTAALQCEMKLRAEIRESRHLGNIFIRQQFPVPDFPAYPLDTRHHAGQPYRVNQPQPDLLAIGRQVDTDQHNLFIACLSQRHQFPFDIGQWFGTNRASRFWNNAIGAIPLTAILDFYIRTGPVAQPGHLHRLKGFSPLMHRNIDNPLAGFCTPVRPVPGF